MVRRWGWLGMVARDGAGQRAGDPAAFAELVERARSCRLCPRMEGRRRVIGAANGAIPARVLFVAEAPGRLGGDRTGVPLSGDRTGRDFARLLAAAGLRREEVFVTNAVLCNPRDGVGRNATQTMGEVRNCAPLLEATIEVVDPAVVVTLGAVALGAVGRIETHGAVLAGGVGLPVRWGGRWLVPLYHPGARAQIRRPMAAQLDDYERLGAFLRGGAGLDRPALAQTPADLGERRWATCPQAGINGLP